MCLSLSSLSLSVCCVCVCVCGVCVCVCVFSRLAVNRTGNSQLSKSIKMEPGKSSIWQSSDHITPDEPLSQPRLSFRGCFSVIQQEIVMVKSCKHRNIVAYHGSYIRSDTKPHSSKYPPKKLSVSLSWKKVLQRIQRSFVSSLDANISCSQ